jgi:hypothetical protein
MIHYNRTGWKSRDFVFMAHYFQLLFFFFFLRHFSASGLSNFGAGAIFQLLVLAIFGDFLEDSFLALFSASGLSHFWRGRHFSASCLSNFRRFFGGFVFATQRRFLPKIKSLSVVRIINKPVGAKFKTGK